MRIDHAVANATQSLDEIRLFAEFLAQAADVGVDRASLDFGLVVPDIEQQMLARLHPPLAFHQQLQKPELGRGQRKRVVDRLRRSRRRARGQLPRLYRAPKLEGQALVPAEQPAPLDTAEALPVER